eukprot:g7471.t1
MLKSLLLGVLAWVCSAAAPDDQVVVVAFDMDPGEGFNFRKKCLHRMLSLARRLADDHKDTNFVIALPPFRNRHGHEHYPFSTFFDLDRVQGALPALNARLIEAEALVREQTAAGAGAKPAFDRELFFLPEWQNMDPATCPHGEETYNAGFYSHMLQSKGVSQWDANDAFEFGKGGGFAVSLGSMQFAVGQLRCHNSGAVMASEERLRKLVWEQVEQARQARREAPAGREVYPASRSAYGTSHPRDGAVAIFLGGFDRVTPAIEDGHQQFWAEREHLHFSQPVRDAAQAWLDKRRDATGFDASNFVALHWRRKDFLRAHADTLCTVDEVARVLAAKCAEAGTASVFLASDTGEAEVEALRSALREEVSGSCTASGRRECPAAQLLTFQPDGERLPSGFNPMMVALVEQLVASRGRYFLGTHHSTFSQEIHYARAGDAGHVAWRGRDGSLTKGGKIIQLCEPDKPAGEEECEPWW